MSKILLNRHNAHYNEFLAHELRVISRIILLLIIIAILKWEISPHLNDVYYLNGDVVSNVVQLVTDFAVFLACYFTILAILYYLTYKLIPDNCHELSKRQIGLLLTTRFFDMTYQIKLFSGVMTLLFTLFLLSVCVTNDDPFITYNALGQLTSITLTINQTWAFTFTIVAIVISVVSLYSMIKSFANGLINHVILRKPTSFYDKKMVSKIPNFAVHKNRIQYRIVRKTKRRNKYVR